MAENGNKATFGVNCTGREDIKEKGVSLLDRIQKKEIIHSDGTKETKDLMSRAEALSIVFDAAGDNLERAQMKRNGVDTDGLDAAFSNIMNLFASVSASRDQIKLQYETELKNERESSQKQMQSLQEKIDQLTGRLELNDKVTDNALKDRDAAVKERDAAVQQMATERELYAEKDKNIQRMESELTKSQEKVKEYDQLKEERDELKQKLDKAELEKQNEVYRAKMELMEENSKLKDRIHELESRK